MFIKIINTISQKLQNDKGIKSLIQSGTVVSVAVISSTILGLLFSLYVSRVYGPEAMGLLAIVSSIIMIAHIIASLGMQTSILRLIPEQEHKFSSLSAHQLSKRITMLLVLSGIAAGVLVLGLSEYAEVIFPNVHNIEYALKISAPFVVVIILSKFFNQNLRALHSVIIFSTIMVAEPLLKLIILIFLSVESHKLIYPVVATLLAPLLLVILSHIALNRVYRKRISVDKRNLIDSISTHRIISVSFPMMITSMTHIIISHTDTIMLGIYVTAEEVGIYSIAYKLSMFTSFFLGTFNSVLAPKYSKLFFSGDAAGLRTLAQRSTLLIFICSVPIALIFYVAGESILSIFGAEFITGYGPLVVLVTGQLVNVAAGSVGYFLNMTGNQVPLNLIVMGSGILNIVLNLILIPLYGVMGAAYASVISIVAWNLLATLFTQYKFSYSISILSILRLWR